MWWLAILLLAFNVQAATLYVSLTGSHDTNPPAFSTWATAATNIQAATFAAQAFDTVIVGPGEHRLTTNIFGFSTAKALTVRSAKGWRYTTINCSVVRDYGIGVSGTNSLLDGFTITGANAVHGTLLVSSSRTSAVANCVFVGGESDGAVGYGLVGLGSRATMANCIVVGNKNDSYGVVFFNASEAAIVGSIIEANAIGGATPGQLVALAAGYFRNSICGTTNYNGGTINNLGGNWQRQTNYTIPGAGYYRPTVGIGLTATLGDYRLRYDATNTRSKGTFTNIFADSSHYAAYDINGLPRCWPYGTTNVDIGPHSMNALDHQTINRRRK